MKWLVHMLDGKLCMPSPWDATAMVTTTRRAGQHRRYQCTCAIRCHKMVGRERQSTHESLPIVLLCCTDVSSHFSWFWIRTGKRGHYERGLFTEGISRISRISKFSRKWSDSPLFSTVWGFSEISRISKFSRESLENGLSWKDPFSKRPLFPYHFSWFCTYESVEAIFLEVTSRGKK